MTTAQQIDIRFIDLRSEAITRFRDAQVCEGTLEAISRTSTPMELHGAISVCFGQVVSCVYLHVITRVNTLIDDRMIDQNKDAA